MRTITIEEHVMDPNLGGLDYFVEVGGAPRGRLGALEAALKDTGPNRIAIMDKTGIDMQMLSQSPYPYEKVTPEQVAKANDDLATLIKSKPTRYSGFAALPLGTPEVVADELERAVKVLGMKGTMINGTVNGRFLDHPDFYPMFEKAVELDIPVYLHPGFPPKAVRELYYENIELTIAYSLSTAAWGWHQETAIHVLRLAASGLFDKLPDLKIVIGHMGEMLPFMLDRVDNRLGPPTKHLKKSIKEYLLSNVWITTSGFFTNPPFQCALDTWGIDRIIYSVDYPYSKCEDGKKFLDECGLEGEDLEKLTHLNVEKLFKL